MFETMASVNSNKIAQRGISPPSFAGFPETDFCVIYSSETYPVLRFGGLVCSRVSLPHTPSTLEHECNQGNGNVGEK